MTFVGENVFEGGGGGPKTGFFSKNVQRGGGLINGGGGRENLLSNLKISVKRMKQRDPM